MENATDIFSYHVEGLSPYTQYLFRVVVSHAHGQTAGPWATLLTAEDRKYTYSHTRAHIKFNTCYSQNHAFTVPVHTDDTDDSCEKDKHTNFFLGQKKPTTPVL